ncbi:hypothetical protein [Bradyrhizobium huanghuaihaiense]|uniref:hypothetical protein n=1 Tax=Bradyrhizobium huanghuaihaiense TaxID=990078 RepID=UPI0011A2E703|nr:hypothetical protein [Bradyrhizobium huanghuaihaiense]
MSISASTCVDLTVCELTKTDTGGDSYTVLTGKMNLAPQSWNKTDNFVSGRSSWSVFGKLVDRSSLEPAPQLIPASKFAVIRLNHLRRLMTPAAFTNDYPGCTAACEAGSPYCFRKELSGIEASGLRQLHKYLLKNPQAISAGDLMGMFSLKSDPCARGDTAISKGILSNAGDVCTLEGEIPALNITGRIQIPSSLEGKYQLNGVGVALLEFEDRDRRPKLSFSDKYVNADWGGDIKSVFGSNNDIGFSVGEKSCLSFKLR